MHSTVYIYKKYNRNYKKILIENLKNYDTI